MNKILSKLNYAVVSHVSLSPTFGDEGEGGDRVVQLLLHGLDLAHQGLAQEQGLVCHTPCSMKR